MHYEVTRPFRANRPLTPGDVFDASDANPRRVARLVERGYLAPLDHDDAGDEGEPTAPARRSRKPKGEPAAMTENTPVTLAEGTNDD